MSRLTTCIALSLLLPATVASASPVSPGTKTVFQEAEKAWAVGTVQIGRQMSFRDGKILVFPSQIQSLVWAPDNTKPRNMMLVHEVFADDGDKPFFKEGDTFVAPIRLLPDHSYWRDNLPNTRRHAVAGGRRNVFRGSDADEATRILGAYLKAHDIKGLERWKGQLEAVSSALVSTSSVLREDGARYLAGYEALGRDFTAACLPPVEKFLGGDAPVAEKGAVVQALAAAKVETLRPVLRQLSARADATGAVALRGLETMGEGVDTPALVAWSSSPSPEVRGWAGAALGRRAGSDATALARASELLASTTEPDAVRVETAEGLAASLSEVAVQPLVAAVSRGDAASRSIGEAIGRANMVVASGPLARVLETQDGEAAVAAAVALRGMGGCRECRAVLEKQHEAHRDEGVRNLIGVMLEVPLEHKH